MTANQRFAAELFPQHTKHSGAAAVMRAADDVAAVADWKRQVIDVLGLSPNDGPNYAVVAIKNLKAAADETDELRCRVQELEAENAELRERIEEYQWDHKDDRPKVGHG